MVTLSRLRARREFGNGGEYKPRGRVRPGRAIILIYQMHWKQKSSTSTGTRDGSQKHCRSRHIVSYNTTILLGPAHPCNIDREIDRLCRRMRVGATQRHLARAKDESLLSSE